jgi:hypothetical protein
MNYIPLILAITGLVTAVGGVLALFVHTTGSAHDPASVAAKVAALAEAILRRTPATTAPPVTPPVQTGK